MKNRIKELRARKNFTQEALAEKANITRGTLLLIERGVTEPSGKTMMSIAKALEEKVEDIFLPDM